MHSDSDHHRTVDQSLGDGRDDRRWGLLSLVVALAMALSAPLLVSGSITAIGSMRNAPMLWIADDFPALRDFERFVDRFGVHETILISWPGCTIDDRRLPEFAERLRQESARRVAAGEDRRILAVPNGYDTSQLLVETTGLSRSAAINRLTGLLVGPDGQTSCAAVELTRRGAIDRVESLEMILTVAEQAVGLDRDQFRLAGPPIDGIAIDRQSIRSIEAFSLPSTILSTLLCWFCLRSLWFTAAVVLVASVGQGVSLAAIHYCGIEMNAVLIVLPPLVFVLTISAGIHLVRYYLEEIWADNRGMAVREALAKSWRPSVLAALTTAIGLASLWVSRIEPIRQFGLLGAIIVPSMTLLLFLLLPGVMAYWPPRRKPVAAGRTDPAARHPHQDANPSLPITRLPESIVRPQSPLSSESGLWPPLARAIERQHRLIIVAAIVLLTCGFWGLTRLSSSLNVVSLLADETRTIQDYRWFRDQIGPLVTVEAVLRFDPSCPLSPLERLALVTEVHAEMLRDDQIDVAISPATFLPPPPRGRGIRDIARRKVFQKRLADSHDLLESGGYFRSTEQGQLWRISGRVAGQVNTDYGVLLAGLSDRLDRVARESSANDSIELRYTGLTPLIFEIQRALLSDLFNSFLTAIVLVGGVMIVTTRGIARGLMTMIPNIFPTVVLFGAMGWLQRPVDIGSVMTACVALGIAVDGTFHFLASYLRKRRAGLLETDAVGRTLQNCGLALLQTTLICSAGMLVFLTSGFLPARHFAWMLIILLVVAAVGDLIVLPALLLSRMGRRRFQTPIGPSDDAALLET